jgi:hypothetical protein
VAVAAIACAVAGTASAAMLTYKLTGSAANVLAGVPNYFNGSATSATESGSWSTQVFVAFEQAPTAVAPGGYFNLTIKSKKVVTRSIRAQYVSGTLTPASPLCAGQNTYTLEAQLVTETGGTGQLTATIPVYQSPLGTSCGTYLLGFQGDVTFVD